jgi:tetratricopeptide (TPR) repeat protein
MSALKPASISKELREAITLTRQGKPEQAIPLLDSILQAEPASFLALRERVFAKKFTGDYRGACEDCAFMIQQWPENPEGFTQRADVHARAGDMPAAVEDYSAALSLDPRHPYAYFQRGRLKAASGDLRGAVSDFTIHMEHDDCGRLSGLLNRGPAKHKLGDLNGAIADLDEAMQLERSGPIYAPLKRGRVKMTAGDYHGAIADFSIAIRSYPGLPNAYRHRAEAYALTGNQSAAEIDRQKYQDLGGCDFPAYQ